MTMIPSVRLVEGQELLDILFWLDNYAFRPTPPFPERDEWEKRIKTRKTTKYYAVFEGDKGLAITACPQFTQNVRGKIYRMGGFADVSTHPAARRKGYSRMLLRHALRELRKEGNVLSCLYPFRESFYERLGYVTFPQSRQAIFKPEVIAPLLKKDLNGEVSLSLMGECYEIYHEYTTLMQPKTHGMALFTDFEGQHEAAQSNRYWLALAKVKDEIVGLMMYNFQGEEMMDYNLRAVRFYYRTSSGKYLLLAWLARHIDQASKLTLWLPAYEQPNTWFADMFPKLKPVFVAPMGRVIDVSGLSGMRTGKGHFAARIYDENCPWNNEIWDFNGDPGHLEVKPGKKEDFSLTIQGLSALIYGINDPSDFVIRGWGDPPEKFQDLLRNMFPSKIPYLHEYY